MHLHEASICECLNCLPFVFKSEKSLDQSKEVLERLEGNEKSRETQRRAEKHTFKNLHINIRLASHLKEERRIFMQL